MFPHSVLLPKRHVYFSKTEIFPDDYFTFLLLLPYTNYNINKAVNEKGYLIKIYTMLDVVTPEPMGVFSQ